MFWNKILVQLQYIIFQTCKSSFNFQVSICDYAMGTVFLQCGKPISLYHLGKNDVTSDSNMDKAKDFIERIQMVHQTMQEQIDKVKGKYIEKHDKNRGDHKIKFNDYWIEIRKVRELYAHLLKNWKWSFWGPKGF